MGANAHVLSHATVMLVDTNTGAKVVLRTGKHGNAVTSRLPYGTCTVTATSGRHSATGKLTVSKKNAKINLHVRSVRVSHKD
jgi:hypothetical protein